MRPCRDSDAPLLAEIFFAAVHEIAGVYYSREQIEAWAPAAPSAEGYPTRANDGRTLFVAVDDRDLPIAYGDCEPDGHIDHLFCRPDHSRKGNGALYLNSNGLLPPRGSRLYVEASEPARRFFAKQGFIIEDRND